MGAVRLNITLSEDVAEILNKVSNKSKFIAEAVRDYHHRKQKEKLIQELKEGYANTRTEDREVSKDWETTVDDGI
jgi:metal-responsive CopG/Arc/MetJ family transcriptional regulator